ncbi:MAG: crossover junction endodeoxyribonuclease RuvC [Bacillota bacterium]
MKVMGIDPGTAITGFGVIQGAAGRLRLMDYGCVRTESGEALTRRLKDIYLSIGHLIDRHQPELIVVEQLFFNRNVRSAFAVGQARGVVLLAAANRDIPVVEFTPLQVKQAVTGYGRANKQQVQAMVGTLLALRELPKPDDAADALAVAICGYHSHGLEMKLRTGCES